MIKGTELVIHVQTQQIKKNSSMVKLCLYQLQKQVYEITVTNRKILCPKKCVFSEICIFL